MVQEAAKNSAQRLFPQFSIADQKDWDKVYERAKKGSPDALKAIGDEGEPAKNTVCKHILSFIAGGKQGTLIREHFEAPPYGLSGDAIDGALHPRWSRSGHETRSPDISPEDRSTDTPGSCTRGAS
jgi:hypothetical protein